MIVPEMTFWQRVVKSETLKFPLLCNNESPFVPSQPLKVNIMKENNADATVMAPQMMHSWVPVHQLKASITEGRIPVHQLDLPKLLCSLLFMTQESSFAAGKLIPNSCSPTPPSPVLWLNLITPYGSLIHIP